MKFWAGVDSQKHLSFSVVFVSAQRHADTPTSLKAMAVMRTEAHPDNPADAEGQSNLLDVVTLSTTPKIPVVLMWLESGICWCAAMRKTIFNLKMLLFLISIGN